MKTHLRDNQKGFSLITIVLLFTILAVMTVGGITLGLKLQAAGKNSKTVDKMTIIRDALQQYYRGHQETFPLRTPPLPTTHVLPADSTNRIPVDALKLEQHFRYDAWGQFYHYDPGDVADIKDVIVDGMAFGAVIVSSGPDQIRQSGNSSPYTTLGDDILFPVNLREQAIEITLIEMRVLQKKLWAWALNLCPSTPSASPTYIEIATQFALGDEFQQDAWLVDYTISLTEIRSSGPDRNFFNSDDLVLSSLDVNCPGGGGLPQPSFIIAQGGFNESGINGRPTDMGSNFGPPDPQIEGSVDRRSPDTPPPGGDWSLKLNGSDNYVSLGSIPVLDPGTGNYAIDVWIKIDVNATGKRVIYGSHSSDSTTIEFFVDDDPSAPVPVPPLVSKYLVFRVEDHSGNFVEARSDAPLSIGDWHHVGVAWNPQLIQLYHNDVQYSATLTPGSPGSVGTLESDGDYYIGRDETGNYFSGLIDEILIFNFL